MSLQFVKASTSDALTLNGICIRYAHLECQNKRLLYQAGICGSESG